MSTRPGIVIVGGGPAGLAAARAYREHGGGLPVTILAAEPRAPYQRPPLSKELLRGELEEHELALEQPGWYEQQRIDLRAGATVTALDTGGRAVEIDGGGSFAYEACVLATGSEPMRLPVPGAEHPGIATLRCLEDWRALSAHGARVAVIGTGFIGCEAAASFAARGARVTLLGEEALPQQSRLGDEAGERVRGWLEGEGIELRLGGEVTAIEPAPGGGWLVHAGGQASPVSVDTVLQAVGAAPRVELARDAGLALRDGAVLADERMRTSAEGVFVAGDLAFAVNAAAGRRLRVEHWGEALGQGAVAGAGMARADARWETAPGFWSTIARRTLKYVAWGDGYEHVRVDDHRGRAFTAWYSDRRGICVGALCHDRDEDYERGRELIEAGEPAP